MLGQGADGLRSKALALRTLHNLGEAFGLPELYTMARGFSAKPYASVQDAEKDDETLRTVG